MFKIINGVVKSIEKEVSRYYGSTRKVAERSTQSRT
jgi:hypothetical protein